MLYENLLKMRGTHGGYYKLYNVVYGENMLADIEILIDWVWTTRQYGFQKMKEWHQKYDGVNVKNLPLEGNTIEFSDVSKFLTGYGRMIIAKNDVNSGIF